MRLSCNLDGSEDSQIMCIKNVPCQELLTRLQSVEVEKLDPYNDIQEEEEEDCLEPEDSDNDEVVEVVWVTNILQLTFYSLYYKLII